MRILRCDVTLATLSLLLVAVAFSACASGLPGAPAFPAEEAWPVRYHGEQGTAEAFDFGPFTVVEARLDAPAAGPGFGVDGRREQVSVHFALEVREGSGPAWSVQCESAVSQTGPARAHEGGPLWLAESLECGLGVEGRPEHWTLHLHSAAGDDLHGTFERSGEDGAEETARVEALDGGFLFVGGGGDEGAVLHSSAAPKVWLRRKGAGGYRPEMGALAGALLVRAQVIDTVWAVARLGRVRSAHEEWLHGFDIPVQYGRDGQ